MIELGLRYRQGPVAVSAIASRGHLPLAYLEQLLNRLRRASLVESVRGPKGGYALTREPVAISLQEIVGALEGWRGKSGTASRASSKNGELTGAALRVWERVEAAMADVMKATTLEEICREAKQWIKGSAIEHRYTFEI